MRSGNYDEYRFDPELEDGHVASEFTLADEYRKPKEFDAVTTAKAADEDEERRKRIKKLLFIPLSSALAAVSLVFASFSVDPLGTDVFGADKIVSSLSFPILPNTDPDFGGDYAWAGQGSEEYVLVDSHFLHAGTYYGPNGEQIETLEGARYDKGKNVLTLENYNGGYIETNLMGNGFKIELIGKNTIGALKIYGAMYGGSVTFCGEGSLKINEGLNYGTALTLECEASPSCVMIKKGAEIELFGTDAALLIRATTLDKALYTEPGVTVAGGEVSVTGTQEQNGEKLYDLAALDENGAVSKHVVFKAE